MAYIILTRLITADTQERREPILVNTAHIALIEPTKFGWNNLTMATPDCRRIMVTEQWDELQALLDPEPADPRAGSVACPHCGGSGIEVDA